MENETKTMQKQTKTALSTGAKLSKEKKITVKVPIDPQNKKDLVVSVTINGYRYEIKRGEKVELPESVVRILEEANYL